jgi:hypothetical protein
MVTWVFFAIMTLCAWIIMNKEDLQYNQMIAEMEAARTPKEQ